MGHTLKLDIYCFYFKRIIETHQHNIFKNRRIGYKTQNEYTVFNDFVRNLHIENNNNYMKLLLESFIKSFDSSFTKNEENTKAISLTSNSHRGFDSYKYTAWGIFKGGTTGIIRDIYKSDNATTATGRIDEDNVSTLQYFYKIWMPKDSNMGILMVQSYTSAGCTVLFKEQFETYILKKGYRVYWSKCIPQYYIDKYFENGYINEIRIIRHQKNVASPLHPLFKSITESNKKIIFSNLYVSLSHLFSINDYKKELISQIKAIDLSYDENRDLVKLFYQNGDKRAHASLQDIENILPIITLDDSLKAKDSQLPDWDELHKFTDTLLEKIKKQIGYTPKEI